MPAPDYPELQGLPADCTQTDPLGFDVLHVSVPYQGVDEVVVAQEPLSANWSPQELDIFRNQDTILNLDSPGQSIGYQTDPEMNVLLSSLKPEASALKHNTAFYHPEAKEAIVALAAEAYELLLDIEMTYEDFEQPKYTSKQGGYVAVPLSVEDDYAASLVEPSPAYPSSMQARVDARDEIRDNYLKAIYLIWCAEYGANQSLSWQENRKVYLESQPEPGGGLQTGPSAPPPTQPGRFTPGQPPVKPARVPKQSQPPPGDTGPFPGGTGPGDTGPDGEPPGPGPFDDFPPPEPPRPSRKRSSGAGAAALVIGVVAVGLLAAKK